MLRVEAVIGWLHQDDIAAEIHRLDHLGRVEWIDLEADDAARHHLRLVTDQGTTVAVVLERHDHLGDGAVLLLEHDRALVVRLTATSWVQVCPADISAALELGHRAGALHWRVRFDHTHLAIGGVDSAVVHDRLGDLVADGRVTVR